MADDAAAGGPRGYLRVYDGVMLKGAIVGGVGPALPEYKVDAFWAKGTDMLFYERLEVEARSTGEVDPKAKKVEGRVDVKPASNALGKRKRAASQPVESRQEAARRLLGLRPVKPRKT